MKVTVSETFGKFLEETLEFKLAISFFYLTVFICHFSFMSFYCFMSFNSAKLVIRISTEQSIHASHSLCYACLANSSEMGWKSHMERMNKRGVADVT